MADITMTIREPNRTLTGANYTSGLTAATSSNVYYAQNNGRVVLLVQAGTTSNLTVETTKTEDGLAVADLTLALADTNLRIIGPFDPAIYNDNQGRLKVTVDANTNLFAIRI
jgi:hypothetical protein